MTREVLHIRHPRNLAFSCIAGILQPSSLPNKMALMMTIQRFNVIAPLTNENIEKIPKCFQKLSSLPALRIMQQPRSFSCSRVISYPRPNSTASQFHSSTNLSWYWEDNSHNHLESYKLTINHVSHQTSGSCFHCSTNPH